MQAAVVHRLSVFKRDVKQGQAGKQSEAHHTHSQSEPSSLSQALQCHHHRLKQNRPVAP
jgi:hypothetical protein